MGETPRWSRGAGPTAAVMAALLVVAGSLVAVLVLDERLRDAGRSDLVMLTVDAPPFIFAMVSATVVGAALALRRRRHPVGWLFLALGCALALSGPAGGYARYGALADPGSLPAARVVAVVDDAVFMVWFVLVALVLQLTPTGQPLSPRWGRVATATVACGMGGFAVALVADRSLEPPFESVGNPIALPGIGGALALVSSILATAAALGLVLAAVSLVVRFRRSAGVERQQLLWLAVVAVLLPVFVVASFLASPGHPLAVSLLAGAFTGLVPLAAGLAVSQYHLYDIDRILSRGLTYLLVSAVLAATYAVVVVTAGQALGTAGGRSELAVVVATLAAVSLAAPAHRGFQNVIDRRFNRRRYDALRVVRNHVRDPALGVAIDDVLREALGDPSLRVAYWVEDRQQWVTADGRSVVPGDDDVEARRHRRTIARVAFDPARVEPAVADGAVAEATPELDNARLRAAITLQLVEVRESRARIAAAQLTERQRIERNLHDGAQQRLLALALQLQAAQVNGEPERLRDVVDAGIGELRAAVVELRELANGLHPAILTDGGLVAALDDLASRTPVPVAIRVTEQRFRPEIEATAWFVVCEAVANAVKHADAGGIDVEVVARDGRLVVAVTDDGVGGADPHGSGLRGIADRAEAVGGALTVETGPGPGHGGHGTTVRVELPCGS